MKKTLLTLVVLVLISLIVASLVFILKLREKIQIGSAPEEKTISIQPSKEGSPIRMASAREGKGVYYELKGTFVNGLNLDQERKDAALFGEFILKGDPLERKIPTYLGAVTGYTLLGVYESSFSGTSHWSMVKTATIPEQISANEEVRVVLDFSLPLSDYTGQVVDIMDKLLSEFSSDSFNYKIPSDFALYANGVGIVKQ